MLSSASAVHGMRIEESTEIIALIKTLELCAVKKTEYENHALARHTPRETNQSIDVGTRFIKECDVPSRTCSLFYIAL